MGARDYAPSTGTFTQLDSVQGGAVNPMTMNRFLYALANPATLIDPDGHYAACPTCDGGGTETDPEADDDSYECQATSCNGGGGGGGHNGGGGTSGGANAPNSTTPVCDRGCETPAFTGYAPWELDADPMFSELYSQAGLNCINQDYDSGECQFQRDVQGWVDHNKEVYCSYHRAECDAHDRGVAHMALGGLGMVPLVGEPFDLLDGMIYAGEGDFLGASLSIGSLVPVLGAGPGALKLARLGDDAADVVVDATRLPPYAGQKTQGILAIGSRQVDLISGYKGPSAPLPRGTPGMHGNIKSHVEAHAAAIMRQETLTEATLYINRIPCPGARGCDAMLPRMLPKARL
jgi:hypothetical protein